MPAELLSFFRPAVSVRGDWSSQEIAEFYRVEAALVQAGLSVFVDRGVSDEGDPWFVFCRATDGEVIVHFARINGDYLIVADSIGRPIRGPNFRQALTEFVAVNPTLIPIPSSRGAKLMLHPASLLAAVVATALYHMSGTEAVASTLDPAAADGTHSPTHHTPSFELASASSFDPDRKWSDRQVAAIVGAMIALAATEYSDSVKEIVSNLGSTILTTENDHIVLPHSLVAAASPITDLDGKVWTAGTLDAHDSRILFDNFILSGGGQAVDGQFQVSSNDGLSLKLPASTTASNSQETSAVEHWWSSLFHSSDSSDARPLAWTETPTSFPNDANVKGSDQFAIALLLPSSSGAGSPSAGDAKPADPNHLNSSLGSSSPVTTSQTYDAQTALALVNNELNAANRTAPEISLNGNLSVQDVISHGVADVFGSASPVTLVAVVGHGDGLDGGPIATTAVSQSGSFASDSPVTISPQPATSLASVSAAGPTITQPTSAPQPYSAAAGEMLHAFVAQNNFEILSSDNHVVFFDTNASDFSPSPDFVNQTWFYSDGSTISIVGVVHHSPAPTA
jgi:hypothetical protein